MGRLKIKRAVVVEGKYDAIRLDAVIDALIVTTDGFAIFDSPERLELLRSIARERGLIVAADSDSAGARIRGFLRGALAPEEAAGLVDCVFMPPVHGVEKRKRRHKENSRDGLLGVEGADNETIWRMFEPYAFENETYIENRIEEEAITKYDIYELGLHGGRGSSELRARLCRKLGLPPLGTNMLARVLAGRMNKQELEELIKSL